MKIYTNIKDNSYSISFAAIKKNNKEYYIIIDISNNKVYKNIVDIYKRLDKLLNKYSDNVEISFCIVGEYTKNLQLNKCNDILENMDEILNNNTFSEITEEMQSRLCIIPFSSVGKQNGIIIGFRPDYIKIYTDQGEKIRKKIVIGIYNNEISKNGVYSGLMGLNLLENDLRTGDLNEYNSNIKI